MTNPQDVALIGALVWTFPDLTERFGEHLSDNDGEVLPHVFMADIERWAEQLVQSDPAMLEHLLKSLSDAYSGGPRSVRDLIGVSFVEELPYPDEPNAEIRAMLPAPLKLLLRHGM